MESQYFRTFIALPLQVEKPFIRARNSLMESLRGERISWTDPGHYHVTLRFLGDTERSAIQGIGNALRDGFTVPGQTGLEISGLHSFGPHLRPRVIWVGFEDSSFFEPLKQEVDRILDSCGIRFEEQPFRAHLTLGRIRSLKNPESYYLKIEEMNRYFKGSVLFDRLVYFQSILGSGRPEYRVLEEMRFSS